jgi:hypothetical protein
MSMWAITTYFNPAGYRTRMLNYQLFRNRLQIPLLTVEHSVDGRFDLDSNAADVLIQLVGGDSMWQKERLLNVALDALPADCDAVAWLDCDVVIDGDWPRRAADELERSVLVQPFSRAREVREGQFDSVAQHSPVRPSFAYRYVEGHLTEDHLGRWRDGVDPVPLHCGYAWVARTETMRRHRFYDASILGGGTRELATAAIGRLDHLVACRPRSRHQLEHVLAWARPFAAYVNTAIGYVDTDAYHLWHGAVANRGYGTRYRILADLGFDPARDIAVDRGCWRWASDKPALHRRVSDYFRSRDEDG